MKTEQPVLITTITAAGTITKNRFVYYNNIQGALNTFLLGVAVDDAVAGEEVGVIVSGIALVEVNEALTRGQKVVSDDNGKAFNTAADLSYYRGFALDDSSADGDFIRVLLT